MSISEKGLNPCYNTKKQMSYLQIRNKYAVLVYQSSLTDNCVIIAKILQVCSSGLVHCTCSLNKYMYKYKYLFFYMTQPNIFNWSLFMHVKYILIYTFIYYCNTLAMICYSNKIPFLKLVLVCFVTKDFDIICILNQCDKSFKVCVFWLTFFS